MNDGYASKMAGWRIFLFFFTGFIVVTAVNAFFVYKAFTTHTGEVTDNAYQRGLAYNKTIAAAAREENLGWQPVITSRKYSGSTYDISLRVNDKSGKAVVFDNVQGSLFRPANAADDTAARFVKQEDGTYGARVSLPFPGLWEVRAVMNVGGQQFHVVKRIVIQ